MAEKMAVELPEEHQLIDQLSYEYFKSKSDVDVKHYVWGFRRKDTELYEFVETLFYHPLFKSVMISTITINAIFLAIETDYKVRYESHFFLEVLVAALVETAKNVIYVLVLLFLLMFIFAILGQGLYGDPDHGDTRNWGTLAAAFFTLFSLVTVDGWTDLQDELDAKKFVSSRTFTIVFILLGFFVFFNMFIAVVIMDIQGTTDEYEQKLKAERHAALMAKKQSILKRQQDEIKALLNQQKSTEYRTFDEMVESFKKTLFHTDPMILEDFCCSLPFIDLYLSSLDRQDATIYKLQKLYYEIVAVLTNMLREADEKPLQSLQTHR
ncbi:cation channel sperm-associated protein 3 isoform X2 [Podarcis raffonei]|uniref:cation channel sperm-associated protein 3 isoform X2 n=1 Tax=Podarcis raffonei TaxID=65483 RepID=UPI0023294E71|nr:cation channel sperm-associated protein 3 isoform X2 [Podarcis raffonei]